MNKLKRLALRFLMRPLRLMLLPWFMWWLPGCAVNDYQKYSAAQIAMAIERYKSEALQAQAKYAADVARSSAMEKIAQGGPVERAVAALSLQFGAMLQQQSQSTAPAPQIAPPAPMGETIWRALGLAIPVLGNAYAVRKQTEASIAQAGYSREVAIAQSRDALAGKQSNDETYRYFAGKVQAPQANNILTGTGAINGNYEDRHDALSGTGAIGGNYTDSNDRPVTNTTTDDHRVANDYRPVTDNHTVTVTPVQPTTPIGTTPITATTTSTFTPWVTP